MTAPEPPVVLGFLATPVGRVRIVGCRSCGAAKREDTWCDSEACRDRVAAAQAEERPRFAVTAPEPRPAVLSSGRGVVPAEAVEAAARAWPTESVRVDEWHPDDARLHRQDGWKSFEERNSAVLAQRQERVAEAVVAAAYPVIRAKVLSEVDAILRSWLPTPDQCSGCEICDVIHSLRASVAALSGDTTTDTGENQ